MKNAIAELSATLTRARPHEELRSQPGGVVLEVLEGDDKGAQFRLSGRRIVIGRSPRCDVTLSDPSVSNRHLELVLTSNTVLLRDLRSRNGTWAGKIRIEEGLLADEAEFRAGRCLLRLVAVELEDVPVTRDSSFEGLIGGSEQMRTLFSYLDRIAPTPLNVLIFGETGTGKSIVAKAIHERSSRRGNFVHRSCASLPRELAEAELFGHREGAFTGATRSREGAFQRAHGGTLFLDEVGELPLELQGKLLTVLDTGEVLPLGEDVPRKVDVRIIAATNRNLREDVEKGRFRMDLLYRLLEPKPIVIPPLRERREDIPLLAVQFLGRISDEERNFTLSDDAIAALQGRYWEGNVRQLRAVVEASALLAEDGKVTARDLQLYETSMNQAQSQALPGLELKLKDAVALYERSYCEHLLKRVDGDIDQAAAFADYSKPGFKVKLKKLGLASE